MRWFSSLRAPGFSSRAETRQGGADGFLDAGEIFAGAHGHVDAVELPVAMERLLRVGDIEHYEFAARHRWSARLGR